MPALGRGEKIPPRDGEAWLTRLRLRLCSALSVIRRRNLCCNRSRRHHLPAKRETHYVGADSFGEIVCMRRGRCTSRRRRGASCRAAAPDRAPDRQGRAAACRSEEHTSELQSLMRISYAVFCLKKKQTKHYIPTTNIHQH